MFLNKINSNNKIFYTTGRLTSEMVIKSVIMEIPIVISRSGFTVWGVELARKANLTLIGRAKGKNLLYYLGRNVLKINNGQKVLVVILAGGKSRRMMGKDKSLAIINKKKLLDICFKRISQQSEMIIINTNNRSLINFDKKNFCERSLFRFFRSIIRSFNWHEMGEKYYPVANWILTVPVDQPFFPR